MKKILLSILVIVFLNSCNMSDSSENLTGGYTFIHEGKDYNLITGRNQIYPNVVEYAYNDSYILACQKVNKKLYTDLFQANLSSDYRIYNDYLKDSISEKYMKSRNEILSDSTIFKIFKNRNVSLLNSEEDIKKSKAIADSIIKNNPVQKKIFSLEKVYWIIELKKDVLFGPLTLKEFEAIKKKKSIDLDFE